jgi:hypothetical protein
MTHIRAVIRTNDVNDGVPRTDAWVWASIAILAASLAWTLLIFAYALTNDPCAWTNDQCVLAFAAFAGWAEGQLLAAIPLVIALIILIRHAVRGNRRLPTIGFAVLAMNVVASAVLLWYLSTLPSYFR